MNTRNMKNIVGAGVGVAAKNFSLCCLFAIAWLLWSAPRNCAAQPALPSFSLIGMKGSGITNLWSAPDASIHPKQVVLDFTPQGTVYGFFCRFTASTNTFVALRGGIQKSVKVAPKLESERLIVWRVEDRKFSVMLELHEEEQTINVIATSVDKRVRNEH